MHINIFSSNTTKYGGRIDNEIDTRLDFHRPIRIADSNRYLYRLNAPAINFIPENYNFFVANRKKFIKVHNKNRCKKPARTQRVLGADRIFTAAWVSIQPVLVFNLSGTFYLFI